MSEAESSQSPQFVASEHAPTRSVGDVVEVICLVVMTLAGLVAWTVGAFSKGYDYDEVLRAHSIWLTAQGLRPYSDFFEVHPPYFVLFSPVMRAISDPVDGIRALRLLTATGNLLFLAGMIVLGRKSLADGTDRRWAWLAVAFVALTRISSTTSSNFGSTAGDTPRSSGRRRDSVAAFVPTAAWLSSARRPRSPPRFSLPKRCSSRR